LRGGRVGVGRGGEDLADRRYLGCEFDDHLRPERERLPRVGYGLDRLDRWALGQCDRFVVTDDRSLIGQFEQDRLAAR
jgi:hypothetical protein